MRLVIVRFFRYDGCAIRSKNMKYGIPCHALFAAVILGGAILLPTTSSAQQQQFTRERGSVLLGMFITDRATSARLDSNSGDAGSDIDLEDDLGLEDSTSVARFGGYYWFKPRHRLDFSIFDLSRDASRPIQETIDFGDQTFEINTVVNTSNDLTITKVDYTFAALNRPRGFLGVIGGLYVSSTKLSLSSPNVGAAESEDVTAPLPVLGVRGEYEITERIALRGAIQWFGIDTGDVAGRLVDTYIGADYTFGERVAVGLALNDVSLSIDATDDTGWNGELDWGYDGMLLYVKVDFGSN
jgi:hypothetical protein